ncbi:MULTISPECIES: hypothetical protein [Aeromonas]|uniref:hypothetical protein n=1 Tax=Aeromonas TaxID=642 RepID=UPI0012F3C3B6|nr:hypothetical protein [Aeromonas salmonicida]VXA77666.1 conserved exported hypothetical protein [Aeromonas salmonicida]
MNKTTTMLLSLLLVSGAPAAQQSQDNGGSTFSVDELSFNLDWDDKQFNWSQTDCLDLETGGALPADCNKVRLNLDDQENRNQPPSTNEMPANQQSGQ